MTDADKAKAKDIADANAKVAAEIDAAKTKTVDASAANKEEPKRVDAAAKNSSPQGVITGGATDDHRSQDQKVQDAELAADRHAPAVNNPRAPEAVAAQHRLSDETKEKLNEQNRPGHEKNMERAEREAHEAQARTQHADDPRANHVPTGKEDNRNTPRVLADGTKVW